MFSRFIPIFLAAALAAGAAPALAQGTNVSFGGLTADTRLPVEVTAESLTVSQANGTAVFVGNVLVIQGEMRMQADEIRVEYDTDGKAIRRLHASGGVLLVNATDAAEAQTATYTIASGVVEMTGDVLMTQGPAAIKGQKLTIDLKTGTGRMEGGVTTTFTPEGN